MNAQSVIQDVSSIASAFNVLVVAIGYYLLVRLYTAWFRETKRERVAGGRPQVVFSADYTHLPEVGIVVRNFPKAPPRMSRSSSPRRSKAETGALSPTCAS